MRFNPIRLLTCLIAVFALAACTTATPRERFNVAATGYNVSVIGVAAYNTQKPFPPAAWEQIQKYESVAAKRLGEANDWLIANPALADTPGAPFPPLEPAKIAIDLLLSQLTGTGVVLIPPSPKPPTTLPG